MRVGWGHGCVLCGCVYGLRVGGGVLVLLVALLLAVYVAIVLAESCSGLEAVVGWLGVVLLVGPRPCLKGRGGLAIPSVLLRSRSILSVLFRSSPV